jgi:outer membrane protein assembly factor BamB
MKKLFPSILLFLLLSFRLYSQNFTFAWLTDTHVGAPGGLESLKDAVNDINGRKFDFALHSGDITEFGYTKDLKAAKEAMDRMNIKYHIIPGNHDVKWSESCGHTFKELWGEDHFNFVYGGVRFIGFSTGMLMRNHGGHAAPETLEWLDNTLKNADKKQPLVIVTHHMLDDELDNWFDVTNRVKGHNVIALLCGHGHVNKNEKLGGMAALMARSNINSKNGWGYCSVTVTPDSLLIYEHSRQNANLKLWGVSVKAKIETPDVDSVQFINYGADIIANIPLNKTISFGLTASPNYICAASLGGTVYCFDLKGKELWRYNSGSEILSRPAVCGDILIAGTTDGELFTIDCRTGKKIKSVKLDEKITSQLHCEKINAPGGTADAVLAGAASGNYYCININTLDVIWKNSDAKGLIECEPLVYKAKVFYGSWDTYVYCCDLETGKNIWRWQGSDKNYYAPAACRPATDGKSIFVCAPDRFVSSIDMLTGKTIWRTKEPLSWESLGYSAERKCIVIKGFDKNVYYVNAEDGKILKKVPIDNDVETMASEVIDVNGHTLFTTRKGFLFDVDKDYTLKTLAFLGTAKAHSVKNLGNGSFAVSNADGRIVIFKLKDAEK